MRKVNEDLAQMIIEAAEDAGYETRSYSGRGMYGESCLGISFERDGSGSDIILDIAQAIHDSTDDCEESWSVINDTLKGARADSMGMGGIIYWPHIPYVDSEHSGDMGSED